MGANTSDADFLKGLGRAKSRRSSQLYKKSPNAAGFTIWQDFFFDQISGVATTSQAQTVVASGSFTAFSGVSGTATTSQAQTIAGSGSAIVASVSGTIATSQAQTIAAIGSAAVASVSGTASTSQAETIVGSGSFAGAGVVSGDVATSQAQTVSAAGSFIVVNNVIYGGGWQPYIMDKREWEKKIPAVDVKAIERVARSSKTGEDAEIELKLNVLEWDARYAKILRTMQENNLKSFSAIRKIQLKKIQEEEDDDIAILLLM